MEQRTVGIFWDFENVHPPTGVSGYEVVSKIRQFVEPIGPVSAFKAYLDVNLEATKGKQQYELQASGVSIIHTPHNRKKEAADKIIIVDLMFFALETSPLKAIVLITGDRDFHYAASMLRHKGHKIYIIHPQITPPPGLAYTAHGLFCWRTDLLECTRAAPEAQLKPFVAINLSNPNTEVCPRYANVPKQEMQVSSSTSIISEGSTARDSLSSDSTSATSGGRGDDRINKLVSAFNVPSGEENWWSFEAIGLKGCDKTLESFGCASSLTYGSLDGRVDEIFASFPGIETIPDSKAADNHIRKPVPPLPALPTTPNVRWSPDELTPSSESPAKVTMPSRPFTFSVETPLSSPIKPSTNSTVNRVASFDVLIKALKQKGASTTVAVRQSVVRKALLKYDPLVFRGYGRQEQLYFKKAEALGLIRLTFGATKATSRQPHIILCSASQPFSAQSVAVRPPQPDNSTILASPNPKPSNSSVSVHNFSLLIDIMKSRGASRGSSYKRGKIGDALLRRDPLILKRLEVSQKQYFKKAEAAGIVLAGAKGNKKSVALCSKYY